MESQLSCVNVLDGQSESIYDYVAAAGQFAQINGVLAALVFAALVFTFERNHSGSGEAVPTGVLILLPVTFGMAVLSAYQYTIVNSYLFCEVVAVLAVIAGPSFVFVVLAILATMATLLWDERGSFGRSAYQVAIALFLVTAVIGIGNVAITVHDARVTFGLPSTPVTILVHTVGGVLASLVALGLSYSIVKLGRSRAPFLGQLTRGNTGILIGVFASSAVLASAISFSVSAVLPDWTSESAVREVGGVLLAVGWLAPAVAGLMAGLLAAFAWLTPRR